MSFALRKLKRHIGRYWPEYLAGSALFPLLLGREMRDNFTVQTLIGQLKHLPGLAISYTAAKILKQMYKRDNSYGSLIPLAFNELKANTFMLFGRKEDRLCEEYGRTLNKLVNLRGSYNDVYNLALYNLRTADFDRTLRLLFDFMDKFRTEDRFTKKFMGVFENAKPDTEFLKKDIEENNSLENRISLGLSELKNGNIKNAQIIFRESCSEKTLDANIFYAKFLETVKDAGYRKILADCTQEIVSSSKNRIEPLGETTNDVFNYKDIVVIKRGSLKSLEDQVESASIIKEIIKKHGDKEVIRAANVIEHRDSYLLPMWYSRGHTLMQTIEGIHKKPLEEREKFELKMLVPELEKVVDYLALIHAKYPKDKLKEPDESFREKIKRKLALLGDKIPDDVESMILDNYSVVEKALSLPGAVLAYSKDAHPENWLIWPNNIVECLDTESRFLEPIQHDLANLLDYGWIGRKTKDYAIDEYISCYNKYSKDKIRDKKNFRLIYLNSVIQRACSLYQVLYGRETRKATRMDLVKNAVDAIDRIKEEFKDEYNEEYANLQGALKELEVLNQVKPY